MMQNRKLIASCVLIIACLATSVIFQNCSGFSALGNRSALNLINLSSAGVASAAWPGLSNSAAIATVVGSKVDASGNLFSAPGATISLKATDGSTFGPSFGTSLTRFKAMVPATETLGSPNTIDVGTSIPDGYIVQYSICNGCTDHPASSFVALDHAGAVAVSATSGKFVSIQFKYLRSGAAALWYDNQNLTCMLDGGAIPPETNSATYSGDGASVRIGVAGAFSGLPVSFKLINPEAPQSPLDIIDANSGTGAAWQASFGMTDPASGINVALNQAVGDSWWQWGWGATFQNGLQQVDWSPMSSDHANSSGNYISNSPCYNLGYRTFDGQLSITNAAAATAHGKAMQITNAYTLRATQDQGWTQWAAEEAFYMSRSAAQSGAAQVYLVGDNKSWFAGPFNPYDYNLTATSAHCSYFVQDDMSWNSMRSDCKTHLSYAIFVYNVAGKQIAMAISRSDGISPFQANLVLAKLSGSCRDANNYGCGNIEWHAGIVSADDSGSAITSFKNGDTVTYKMLYTVGTLDQLADLGFTITAPIVQTSNATNTTSQNSGQATQSAPVVQATPIAQVNTVTTSSAGASAPPAASVAPRGWIVGNHSGKCVELPSTALGTQIQQFDCHTNPSTDNQQWKFVDKGNGYYEVHNQMTDGCLEVVVGSSAAGAAVVHGYCGGADSVLFRVVSGGVNGTQMLVNKASQQCLDIIGDAADNWVKLQQMPCINNSEEQSFSTPL